MIKNGHREFIMTSSSLARKETKIKRNTSHKGGFVAPQESILHL